MEKYLNLCAMVASVLMPFFNIPLIVRIIKRRSSNDLSLFWLLGVYACMLLMLPYGILYGQFVLKTFSITNVFFFSFVVASALWFRIKKAS